MNTIKKKRQGESDGEAQLRDDKRKIELQGDAAN